MKALAELVEQELLARGAREQPDGEWRFSCPVPEHPDNRPSAYYNPEKQVWFCQSQGHKGGLRDLAWLLNIQLPDEVHDQEFIYRSEDGRPLFRVVRPKGLKDFRQHKADGNGGWLKKLGDARRVPYGLPELVASDGLVLVVEGEKDVHTARKMGYTATTNPMGAGKWRDEFSDYLKGRDVAIIPDKDEAGIEHRDQMANSLAGVASSIRCLEPLPGVGDKGDLTDWVQAGGTKEQLDELIATTEPETNTVPGRLSFKPLSEVTTVPIEWLIPNLLPVGEVSIMFGDPGVGKSTVAAAIASAVSTGDEEVIDSTESHNVLFMSAEDSPEFVIKPRMESLDGDMKRVSVLACEWKILDETVLADLRNEVEELNPALLIIDPLVAALGAKVDMYRANEVRPFMERLGALARETKTAVLVIHHTNKGSGQRAAYRASGSLDFTAAARVTMAVDIVEPESGLRAVVVAKSNYGPTNVGLNFSLDEGKFEWLGPSNVTAEELLSRPHSSIGSPALDDAEEFLKDKLKHGAVSQREIVSEAEQVGIALTTLKRAKTKLGIKSRRISSKEVTGAGHWEWYFPEQGDQGDQGDHSPKVETLDSLDSEQAQEVDTSGTEKLSYFQDRGDGLIEPSQQQFDGLGVTYDGMGH